MKDKIIEIGKNILIVLLLGSLLLLTIAAIPTHSVQSVPWLSKLLQPIAPVFGWNEAELTYVAEAVSASEAAKPIAISVMNSAGRSTAMWDFSQLDSALDRFSPFVTQAMNSGKNYRQVTNSQVQAALQGRSIYLHYGAPQHPSVLADWFGSRLNTDIGAIDGLILSSEDSKIVLYLLGSTFYATSTELSSAELLSVLTPYEPDGSAFAFETPYTLAPLSLLPGSRPAVPAVTLSTSTGSRSLEELATALGFNPYGESRYTDDLGTVSFSENDSSLEVTTDGKITYEAKSGRFSAENLHPESLARTAQLFLETVCGNTKGEGRLYLTSLTQSVDSTVCRFDYYVSGVPVVSAEAPVLVTFTGTSITQAQVQLYSFTATGKTIYPLPVAQAAALLDEGHALELSYCIHTDGTLSAGWNR